MRDMWSSPLTKAAIIGGVVVLGATTWMESRLQSNFRQQGYYQDSLTLLHKYKPAADVLGRPIYGGRVNLSDVDKFRVDLITAKLSVPLTGSKGKGVLHVLASREKLGDKWEIDLLDLEILDSKQRWTFYDRTHSQASVSQASETHTDKT